MSKEKEPFVGFIYECGECGGKMQSTYPGEFSACECGKSFVDETRYYTRLGGSVKRGQDFIDDKEEEND